MKNFKELTTEQQSNWLYKLLRNKENTDINMMNAIHFMIEQGKVFLNDGRLSMTATLT